MPIPKPRADEAKEKFISRCMGDSVMLREYPDKKKRAGVCYTQWENQEKAEGGIEREMVTERIEAELTDVKLLSAEAAEASPFASRGYQADDWKAFVEFKINHSMPVVAGPLVSGNYTAYHPAVIARSYQSLIFQQMNLRHLIKSYAPKSIARDRIVGCIIGAHYPMQAAWGIPAKKEDAIPITAVASLFKQAEGVPKLLGDHLASKQKWSVSIEVVFQIADAGIYLPSNGTVTPMTEMTEEMRKGMKRVNGVLKVGRLGGTGEQMVIAPGGTGHEVAYQGVGMTPNPAETEAEILSVVAEKLDEGTMALAAEAVPVAMFPRGVRWYDIHNFPVRARVLKVHAEGEIKLGRDRRTAQPDNPILHCVTRSGQQLLRSLKSVRMV